MIFCCAALPLCFPVFCLPVFFFFGMGSIITKTDVHSMNHTSPLMLSPTPNSWTSNPLTLSSVFDYYTLIYLRWLSGCFFGAIKFLVTFAIFLDFCKQFLLNIFLLELRQKFVAKFCYSLQSLLNLLFLLCLRCFLHISDSFFNSFFVAKIAKTICYEIFATVFDPGHKWRATRWH